MRTGSNMIYSPRCSVCRAEDWEEIGRRTYHCSAMTDADDYTQRRLRVLFEIWCPGETEVTLRSLLCRSCGFVTYAPRPGEEDLDRKYRFLTSLGLDTTSLDANSATERGRAQRLWKKLRRRLPKKRCRILDFGGSDGRLVLPLAEHGHDCFVIDYSSHLVPGVERIGSTLDELPDDVTYDVIVCSHVIEHVAEPFTTVSLLVEHMSEGGVIYIEVPMEIWRKAPLHDEPVTHVNFFTAQSLQILMQRCGLSDDRVRLEGYQHPAGHRAVVVSALGRRHKDRDEPPSYAGAVDATRSFLNPPLHTRIQRALLNPSTMPSAIAHRIRRGIARTNAIHRDPVS